MQLEREKRTLVSGSPFTEHRLDFNRNHPLAGTKRSQNHIGFARVNHTEVTGVEVNATPSVHLTWNDTSAKKVPSKRTYY